MALNSKKAKVLGWIIWVLYLLFLAALGRKGIMGYQPELFVILLLIASASIMVLFRLLATRQ
jgi:hypothetical protein